MTATLEPMRSPEKPEQHKTPKDLSLLGRILKIASFPIAGSAAFWVMDSAARGEIIDVELKSSEALRKNHALYLAERSNLSNAVDSGAMGASEALLKREVNHSRWRQFLYDNLEKKGFNNFSNKFAHLRRIDKQKIIIEGITVGTVILGAFFAVASSEIFKKRGDDEKSR